MSLQDSIEREYRETLGKLRVEHVKHDELEAKAQRASRASMASYDKLAEIRDHGRKLREAYAALTGEDLDTEIKKAEDTNGYKAIERLEKSESRTLSRTRWQERPEWLRPGSTQLARDAVEA